MPPFGVTIPVTTLNNGFLGAATRMGKKTVRSSPVLLTTPNPISFGQGVTIIPTAGGGDSVQSIADFIAGGGTFTAAKFAGTAYREVKTNLSFSSLTSLGTPQIGSYMAGEMCDFMEEGSTAVQLNVGTPASQGPVFVRILANGAIPAGVVGGFEAAADSTNTVQLTGVVFRTGVVDANGVVEITMLNRVAA